MQSHANVPAQPRCHNTALCVQNSAHKERKGPGRCVMPPWLSLCAGLSRVPGSRVHALQCERMVEGARVCLRGRGAGDGARLHNARMQNVCGRPVRTGASLATRAAGPTLVAFGVAMALHGASMEPTPRAELTGGRTCIVHPSLVARLLAVGGKVHPKRSAKAAGPSARL